MKIAVLLNETTGPLQQHLQLLSGQNPTYARVKQTIIEYYRSTTAFSKLQQLATQSSSVSTNYAGGQAPMDIDANTQRKRKRNTTTKEKEKAKESTKEKATEDTTATGTTIPKEKGNMEEKDTTIIIRLGMATLLEKAAKVSKEKTKDTIKEKERTKENK